MVHLPKCAQEAEIFRYCNAYGASWLSPPPRNRSERHFVASSARLSSNSTRKSSFTPRLVLHLSQGLEAQQRVPAHLEEPVIAANRSSGMNQLCPYLGDPGLDWVGGSLMLADTALRDDRCRKSAPINLAVWRQWNLFHRHEVLRNHVLRQACPQMLAQAERSQCPRLRRHAARDNAHVVRLDLPQMHGHLAHLRVLGKHRLDLAQLDAVSHGS